MKPFYFVDEVIKQLQGFDIQSIHFELHVGGNGMVGDGNSVLEFDVVVPKRKAFSDKELEKMLGE